MMKLCLVISLVFSAGAISAQSTQQTTLSTTPPQSGLSSETPGLTLPAGETIPAVPLKISYVGGQLTIEAHGSTLADILTKVAGLTGAKIDVPTEASKEDVPILELGPGTARHIVTLLLSDSNFDYLIQGSDADPDNIHSVVVIPREKKGNSSGMIAAARPGRSPYGQTEPPVRPEEAQPLVSAPNPAEAAAQVDTAGLQNGAAPQDQLTPVPDPSIPLVPGQIVQTNVPKTLPVPVPAVMSQPNISQQLQQMYQQRVQMQQQQAPGSSLNPGGK